MRHRWKSMAAATTLLVATVAGTTTATVAAEGKSHGIKVATHNTLHGKAEMKQLAGVVGWQEVDSPGARSKLRKSLPEHAIYFPKDGAAKSVPISWNKSRYKLLKSGSVRTHKGEPRVTPHRYVNWVKLEHKAAKKPLLVLNTHFISGAWNKHPNRQARWNKHADKLRALINKLSENNPGSPIVLVGDFNRRKDIALPHNVNWVGIKGGNGVPIDQIHAQTKRLAGVTKAERLAKFGSDHNAYRFSAKIPG